MSGVQWWCSARGTPWIWSWQAYPGIWLVTVAAGAAVRRRPPALVGGLLLWAALDWPLGPLGTGYLASAHAVQFIVLAMVVPPLLLLGVDREAVNRWLPRHPGYRRLAAVTTQPLLAAIAFTIVMGATHVPWVVDTLMARQVGTMALDLSWLGAGLVFWWPVVVGTPARGWFHPLAQLLYLFAGTQAHLLIAMWLLTAEFPLYATYELAPRVVRLSALDDQRLAGAIMIAVTEPLILTIIGVIFFRWVARSERGAEESGGQPA